MGELLSAVQVAVRLGMHPDQVYYHVRLGRIPCVRIGRSVRFVESQIERWLEEGGSAGPPGCESPRNGEEVCDE